MENNSKAETEKDPKKEQPAEKDSSETSVDNGKKMIDVEKKLDGESEEGQKKDAEKWRNEG